ncbi:MAG TPA: DUF2867 domain-containing protein [Solirubrobacterales bacterium]|nr:DUF2867 domain-containing protein [Solirubrobacterales bacterium]
MTYGLRESGRVPNAEQELGAWRIHEIVPDFELEDVWALPVQGGAGDFDEFLQLAISLSPADSDSAPTRFLWNLRDQLGRWFGLGRISAAAEESSAETLAMPGSEESSLLGRLPDDLRGTGDDVDFGRLPFTPLYRTDNEAAAEISNQTVHGVAHLAWVDRGGGSYQGQMAVYVKPRGAFGRGYMALIKPFRYWIVYPALLRQLERAWSRRNRA